MQRGCIVVETNQLNLAVRDRVVGTHGHSDHLARRNHPSQIARVGAVKHKLDLLTQTEAKKQ